MAATSKVHLAGSGLNCPCHVCAFYSSAEEQYEVLLPFLKEGWRPGNAPSPFARCTNAPLASSG
jgi:hypothetical protein